MIIPEWLVQEPVENRIKNMYNPKQLKQLARDNFKLDDKQINRELAKKMLNPYYFSDRNLKVIFKYNLDSHQINHAISKLTVTPNYPEFKFEDCYTNEIIKELSVIYAS